MVDFRFVNKWAKSTITIKNTIQCYPLSPYKCLKYFQFDLSMNTQRAKYVSIILSNLLFLAVEKAIYRLSFLIAHLQGFDYNTDFVAGFEDLLHNLKTSSCPTKKQMENAMILVRNKTPDVQGKIFTLKNFIS